MDIYQSIFLGISIIQQYFENHGWDASEESAVKFLRYSRKSLVSGLLNIYDLNGGFIDQGLILFFSKPHSPTGEDVIEFHVHGSISIIKKRYSKSVMSEILDNLINDNLREVLLEKRIRPSVQPTVNVKNYEEGKDLSLNVIIQKMPDIKKIDSYS